MATVDDFIHEWNSESQYITAHTSGSTGKPKEIRLLKSDMIISATATNNFFCITENSALGLPLSIDYIAGKMMVVRAMLSGARLLTYPVSNAITLDCKIDLLAVVPSQIESLINNNSIKYVNKLLIGGAPLDKVTADKLHKVGVDSYVGYGMTETCSHIAIRRIQDSKYSAMPGITFSEDSRGCLVIKSLAFSWRQLATNDVVHLIDDKHFEWLGRIDNVIISGGLKIHPEQLEAEIHQIFPALPPFYITKEPSLKWGEVPVLVIESSVCNITTSDIKRRLSDSRHAPARIIQVDKLPLTGTKLRRLTPERLNK